MSAAPVAKPDASGPQPGDLVAGKYRIDREIGHGGMGRVLAATNEATGKQVALKWVLDTQSGSAAARFAREARAAGRVHHPNVVDVYDVVDHDGTPCIVMELLRGRSLAEHLAGTPRLPVEEAVSIAIEIARGVAAAHDGGVIHRDLKPANIFLPDTDDGRIRVKVLDFGISKIIEADPELVTHTGVILGTPHYLSPEQVRGAPDIDGRVDVYAIGAVLYEMLVGHPPHRNSHVPALLVDIATVVPVPPRSLRDDIPEELSRVVMRALDRDRSVRFPDARSLADALAGRTTPSGSISGETRRASVELLPTLEAPTPMPPSLAPPPRPAQNRPSRTAIGLVAVVALLALAALGWSLRAGVTQEPREPSPPVAPTPQAAAVMPAPPELVTATPPEPPPVAEMVAPTTEPAAASVRPRSRARATEPAAVDPAATTGAVEVRSPVPPAEEPSRGSEPAGPPPSSDIEHRAGRLGLDDF